MTTSEIRQPVASAPPDKGLRREIGLPGLLFQSVTHMAPGFSVLFAIPIAAAFVAGSLPLAIIIGGVTIVLLAITIGELARRYPSAGGLYAYATRSLGPSTGFLVGWGILLAENLTPPIGMLAFAFSGQQLLGLAGVSTPVWPWIILSGLIVFFLLYRGARLSMRSGVVLGGFEVAVFVGLAITFIVNAGASNQVTPFTISYAPHGVSSIFTGMLFVVFGFVGFEAVVPMAEEAKSPAAGPRKVLVIAAVIIGIFYLLTAYGAQVGIGFMHGDTYSADTWTALTRHLGISVEALMLFAVLNSSLAVTTAASAAATRVMYAMGRAHAAPTPLAKLHPKHGSPVVATCFTVGFGTAVALILTYGLGGPLNGIGWASEPVTLTVLVMYYIIGGCISALVLFNGRLRAERNWILHVIIPLIALVLMGAAVYKAVIPLPAYPLWIGLLLVPVWMLAGGILLLTPYRKRFNAANTATIFGGTTPDTDTAAGTNPAPASA